MLPLDPMIIRCLRVWVGCTTSPLTLWRYHWQFSCWLYVSIWSCFTLFMRHCREGRFSSCIITRSFSCRVPIDRCHLFSVTVVNILCSRKIFVELADIGQDLHFDFSFSGISDQCIIDQKIIKGFKWIGQRNGRSGIQTGFY